LCHSQWICAGAALQAAVTLACLLLLLLLQVRRMVLHMFAQAC
jgi:hypothetical protein